MRRTAALALAALTLAVRPLHAQLLPGTGEDGPSASAAFAYVALSSTPMGGLPPAVTAHFAGTGRRGVGFRGQFGYIDEEGPISRRNFAAGIDVPFGRSTLGLTAGFADIACDLPDDLFGGIGAEFDLDCKGGFMAGANWTAPVMTSPLGTSGNSTFLLGIDGGVGYGTGDLLSIRATDPTDPSLSLSFSVEARALSFGLGLPLAIVAKSGGVTLVPHLRPGLGYGRATLEIPIAGLLGDEAKQTESDARFMLGGGLDLLFPNSGLGLSVGFNKIFVEDGSMVMGAGFTFAIR